MKKGFDYLVKGTRSNIGKVNTAIDTTKNYFEQGTQSNIGKVKKGFDYLVKGTHSNVGKVKKGLDYLVQGTHSNIGKVGAVIDTTRNYIVQGTRSNIGKVGAVIDTTRNLVKGTQSNLDKVHTAIDTTRDHLVQQVLHNTGSSISEDTTPKNTPEPTLPNNNNNNGGAGSSISEDKDYGSCSYGKQGRCKLVSSGCSDGHFITDYCPNHKSKNIKCCTKSPITEDTTPKNTPEPTLPNESSNNNGGGPSASKVHRAINSIIGYGSNEPNRCAAAVRQYLKAMGHPRWNTIATRTGNLDPDGTQYIGPPFAASFAGTDLGEHIMDKSKLKPGDILLYRDTDPGWTKGAVTHVGVYYGNGMQADHSRTHGGFIKRSLARVLTWATWGGAIRLKSI